MQKRQKRQHIKMKLKRDMSKSGKKKYTTTYKDIKKYFKLINAGVFENRLSPFNDVKIRDLTREKCVGQVVIHEQKRKGTRQYVLEMLPKYEDKPYFLDTLAHEMVHLYQMQNAGDTGNHNDLFYSFVPKLKQVGLGV
tara:strand:+ start:1022 stop:1435 length:414 start_codon:yes stop_codon:yes gene_type:complete